VYKICRIGLAPTGGKIRASVFVAIKMTDGGLSITGVVGPNQAGGCRGSCGQCREAPLEVTGFADGWNKAKARKLVEIWDRWHLNDMNAGSAVQMEWMRNNPVEAVYPESHYVKAGAALAAAGLNPDADGYKYGSAWKREDVPQEVIDWLMALPDADKPCPWGRL